MGQRRLFPGPGLWIINATGSGPEIRPMCDICRDCYAFSILAKPYDYSYTHCLRLRHSIRSMCMNHDHSCSAWGCKRQVRVVEPCGYYKVSEHQCGSCQGSKCEMRGSCTYHDRRKFVFLFGTDICIELHPCLQWLR